MQGRAGSGRKLVKWHDPGIIRCAEEPVSWRSRRKRTAMSEIRPSQQCPICGSVQPLAARVCPICGAALSGEQVPVTVPKPDAAPAKDGTPRPRYDPASGDDDLYVGELAGKMWRLVVAGVAVALILVVAGVGMIAFRSQGDDPQDADSVRVEDIPTGGPTVPPTATARAAAQTPTETPTRRPTMALATVTPAPPTATDTPTPGPCMQTAQEGDTVYGMASRCGHVDLSIVDLILEINDMDSPNELQINQVLEIPWPTPTPGGEPTEEAAPEGDAPDDGEGVGEGTPEVYYNEFGTPDALAYYQNLEPTLRPGQAWHTVQTGETIVAIAFEYGVGLETLSQINPEVPFLQCDFGSPTGGENCSVMLYEGQRIRVPVPLASETPTPTPVGTLTPTPTHTPTFNAPYPVMPDDGAHYNADQIVTLRWGGTGTLGENEKYRVRVRDMDTGMEYTALVSEPLYVVPGGWQPADRERHTFEWTVSIAQVDDQQNVVSEDHVTDAREFTWDSR